MSDVRTSLEVTNPEAFWYSYLGSGSYLQTAQKTIISSENGWSDKRTPAGDVGSEFLSIKHRYSDSGNFRSNALNLSNGPYWYSGWYTFDFNRGQFMAPANSDNITLMGKGTTAIARCIPTNPVSDVSTALGELARDGLPDVPLLESYRDRTRDMTQKAGSEYLNVEFGWKPMISDLTKLANAARKSHKILDDYRRGSGRKTRSQYRFETESSKQEWVYGGVHPYVPTATTWFYWEPGTLYCTETVQKDTWFSGAFTYLLDPGEDRMGKMLRASQEAKKLYGARITPDVLWNIAPWSWAADWVTNIGDIVHNASAFSQDGLVMLYGYLMEHTISTREYRLEGHRFFGDKAFRTDTMTFVTETKRRIPATPFGFGLDTSSFTGRQLAIVAALGLSHDGKRAR